MIKNVPEENVDWHVKFITKWIKMNEYFIKRILHQKGWLGIKFLTRRLCILANTKLYHQNLLLWISMKFWILVSTTLGLFSKDPPIYPNTHAKLTKIKIKPTWGQKYHYLNIYLVINWSILLKFCIIFISFLDNQ